MFRLTILGLLISAAGLCSYGQDLGSSNKLFGELKKKNASVKPSKKPSTTAAKKPSAPSKTATTKTAGASAKSEAVNKTSSKKSVKISRSGDAGGETSPKANAGRRSETNAKKVSPGVSNSPAHFSETTIIIPEKGTAKKDKTTPADIPRDAAEQFEELILKGNTYRDDRDYAFAEAAYNKAKLLKPSDSRAVYGLGNLYSDQLRWLEGEKQYRQAIAMSPQDPVAHIALSYVLVQPVSAANLADRYEEAEKLARRALELAPGNALAYDQLGVSLELRGFIGAETEKAYRKAIELDPSFAPPHAHLGRLLHRRGQNKEASAAYQNAVDRSRDVGTKILVAEVLQSEQRYSESETLLQAALKEDQKNPTALLLLSQALVTMSKYDEAEDALKRALSVGANGFMTNNLLARIHLRQGKLEAAQNALQHASRYVSELDRLSLSQSFEALGDAYMKVADNKNAERAFKQAISFDSETQVLSGKLSRAQQGRFSPGN
jgi:tetratricopeptide (TPR) repeat protein